MKVLILAPNYIKSTNWGHQLWRNEIARQHEVVFHGSGHKLNGYTDVLLLEKEYGPFDVITVGENPRHFRDYENIDKCQGLKVVFTCDYFGSKEQEYNYLINKHKCDVIFLMSTDCLWRFKQSQMSGKIRKEAEGFWLPWTVDLNVYQKTQAVKKYDVMCVYGLYSPIYPKRDSLQEMIDKLPYKTITGNWTRGNLKRERYVTAINESKIFVSVNGIYNELTMKYMECLACGTLLLTDKPRDFEIYGFEDRKHMVLYRKIEEVPGIIDYYLKNDKERKKIEETGMKYVRSNFSNEKFVGEVTKIWEKVIRIKS